ncbi:MAG: DUF2505 family protein [Acidimicrobiales bacterium]
MKFSIRQAVAVPPARAVAAYGSPAFYRGRPRRDDIEVVEVLRHDDSGARILIEVRFAFTGSVSPAVRAVIDPAKMSWITRTEVDPAEARTSWEVLPDHYADRLSARGGYRFEAGADGPASSIVAVEGELKVHVPIVGRSVERVIVSDLRAYIEDEVASISALGG